MLRAQYTAGVSAALEKLGVSGAMYARALQGAAQQSGGRIAPKVLSQVAAQPRAARSSFLSSQARDPGALKPTMQQAGNQALMAGIPWANAGEGGIGAPAANRFNQALQATGRTHAAPGLNQQIVQQFGHAPGQGPAFDQTMRVTAPAEPTVAGRRRPVSPTGATVSVSRPAL